MQIANRAVSSLFCNTTNHYLPPTTANTQPKTSPPPPLLLLPSYHCPARNHSVVGVAQVAAQPQSLQHDPRCGHGARQP
ncbi:hypothetical protein GGP41_003386 [Bipolaris sorokiniana]|uniref:Uncharacterized protein n=1 Tax=Cochliobolus sativus TaxID=45130 RepID=A0A8H5ZD84_COCSA|nr:hypothetical protein GGP41_003386 [Bipolaris sorokiniana]